MGQFEWDRPKAKTNSRKHDVSFDEVTSVFRDAMADTIDDPLHSNSEGSTMKRSARSSEPEMLAEYDFSNAVRGKYASRFGGGRNIVALEPDVFKVSKDEKSVNDALRVLCAIIKKHRKK